MGRRPIAESYKARVKSKAMMDKVRSLLGTY
ncbi:hypothetical protein SAMN05720765_10123 [Fibrobacter sp. UWH6]|nr:hypothetical protein SAMN05720765_10123 [Fibrobacter sp. UWH6]